MIQLHQVSKIYNQGKANAFQALNQIDLEIADGELVAIVGTSGAGKSTLLHILACIDSYESGEYRIDNVLVKSRSEKELARIRNEKIGMVMQDYALINDFSAIENVLLPLDFAKKQSHQKKELALQAMEVVGMKSYANKSVSQLSGGQKQRIAIARAIVNHPSIILADEPTGALDSNTSGEIMALFHKLHAQGKTIVIVTHDQKIASQCQRIIQIEDGRILM